jgi:signal recognition particle receptor subunit beta
VSDNPTSEPETYWIGVTGDFASGKTALIRSISEQVVVSVEYDIGINSEIAFDFGRIKVDENLCLDLHGNPGAYSSSGILKIPKSGLLGLIVMINTAEPRSFRGVRSILETLRAYYPVPYVVAANPYEIHYDPDTQQLSRSIEGWPIDDLRTMMRLPDEIPIMPCIAVDRASVKAVLIALLEKVIEAIDAPDEAETLA